MLALHAGLQWKEEQKVEIYADSLMHKIFKSSLDNHGVAIHLHAYVPGAI